MKKRIGTAVVVSGLAVIALGLPQLRAQTNARQAPKFQVDPAGPKIPNNWQLGQVSSVSIDEQDHAWVLQRPSTLRADQKGRAAPPVLEFDEAGNFVQGWGGPGAGYDWPESEHGIYVDPKGFVWIGGNGTTDHHLLKFTKAGKFVMQIGRKGAEQGQRRHAEREHGRRHVRATRRPTSSSSPTATATGASSCSTPTPARSSACGARSATRRRRRAAEAAGARDRAHPAKEDRRGPQFVQPVHAARVSNDGLVYVSDRGGKRVQVFTLDGKFVTQVFIDR